MALEKKYPDLSAHTSFNELATPTIAIGRASGSFFAVGNMYTVTFPCFPPCPIFP